MNTYQDSMKNILNIEIGNKTFDKVKVTLYNMFGQAVLNTITSAKNGKIALPVATLSYGTYQAHIQTEDRIFVKRVTKR